MKLTAILKRIWTEYCIQRSKDFDIRLTCASLIQSCVENRFETRNQLCLVDKLADDFWFSRFDVNCNFTFEDIYGSIPDHCNMPWEEIMDAKVLSDELKAALETFLPLKPIERNKIINSVSTIWKGQNSDKPSEYQELLDHLSNKQWSTAEWQKKLIPLSEALEKREGQEAETTADCKSLILVCSLLEKATNLGGLCRTSEIFGISDIVLGNKKVLDDHNFKNLSVSSENWLNISEVKPHNLSSFLKEKREEGYFLIGLEQTTSSVDICDFRFGEKSVLVLGNEKSGIPTDIIQLMDRCIEIPQCGVIRD